MERRVIHNISWSVFWKGIVVALLAVFAYIAIDAIIVVFLSLILSSALEPVINILKKKRIPRILSVLFIYLLVLTAVGIFLVSIVPIVVSETTNLITSFENLDPQFNTYLGQEVFEEIKSTIFESTNLLLSSGGSIISFLASLLGGITVVLATGVITFYILINEDGVINLIKSVVPATHEHGLIRFWLRVRKKLGRWLQGQILLSFIIGLTTFIVLKVLGVHYALILAIVAGLFEIVPIAGPIFAGALAVAVALTQSTNLAFMTFIAFLIIQQFENHALVPLLTKKLININPVVVIVALMAGSSIGGIIGMILAIPLIVLFQELVEDWAGRKKATTENLS